MTEQSQKIRTLGQTALDLCGGDPVKAQELLELTTTIHGRLSQTNTAPVLFTTTHQIKKRELETAAKEAVVQATLTFVKKYQYNDDVDEAVETISPEFKEAVQSIQYAVNKYWSMMCSIELAYPEKS